ncbi:MCE family protein [Actinomadura alba]|uniref:MCE family protein n=1 Tax=Actinomadura alba TaxID=406431 RepID=UPI0028AE7ECD|nr:MCE family protein [Actinomadura alba]
MKPAIILRLGALIIAVALVAGAVAALWPGTEQRRLTAYFTGTVGLYPGADVRILGIQVGRVTSVTPVGRSVRVELVYDARQRVPANAEAVIVNQSLVADRYVQLTPVYRSGPVLADQASLPLTRTRVPVEVDQISGNLSDLSKALGPDGANANGSLSRLLQVGANTLDGQGTDIRQTIRDTSRMLSTLSEDRGDVAETIENLRVLTGAMAQNDQQIKRFTQDLSSVSAQLSGEREELSAALRALGPTLRNVTRFVKGNRTQLAANVRQLAQITSVLVKEKGALAEFLTTAPTGLSNLAKAYDPISGTLGTRADLRQFHDIAQWICSLAFSLGTPAKQCESLLGPLNPAGKALTSLSLDLSWITAITTHYDPVPPPPDAYGPGDRRGGGGGQGARTTTADRRSGPPPSQGLSALLPGGGP